MRKMRTRIGSILLACAMLLTFSPVSVFAVDSEQEEPTAAGQEVMSEETSQPASNAAADTDAPLCSPERKILVTMEAVAFGHHRC